MSQAVLDERKVRELVFQRGIEEGGVAEAEKSKLLDHSRVVIVLLVQLQLAAKGEGGVGRWEGPDEAGSEMASAEKGGDEINTGGRRGCREQLQQQIRKLAQGRTLLEPRPGAAELAEMGGDFGLELIAEDRRHRTVAASEMLTEHREEHRGSAHTGSGAEECHLELQDLRARE